MSVLNESSQIFCTFGRGNCNFVKQEVYHKLDIQLTTSVGEGKLSFQCSTSKLQNLRDLKSVERIFFLVNFDPNITLGYKSDFYNLISLLEKTSSWQEVHSVWLDLRSPHQCEYSAPVKKRKKSVSFRVSCRCRQRSAKLFDVKRLSRTISKIIQRKTQWESDLKQPDIEISLHINGEGTVIGIPLFEKPLAERSYLKHHGLRSTTAWILASLAHIQDGDHVLDPMCGKGVILIEAAKEWQNSVYLGSDINAEVVSQCRENIDFAHVNKDVTLFQADVTKLPLGNCSIDKIICDMPFGINHGCLSEVTKLYPHFVCSMDRVLKAGGVAVLLTSACLKERLFNCCGVANPQTETNTEKQDGAASSEANTSELNQMASDCSSLETDGVSKQCENTSASQENIKSRLKEDVPFQSALATNKISSSPPSVSSDQNDVRSLLCENEAVDGTCCQFSCETLDNACDIKHEQIRDSNEKYLHSENTNQCLSNSTDCQHKSQGLKNANVYKEKSEQVNVSSHGNNHGISSVHWSLISEHYLKLGETHAHACVFRKPDIDQLTA